MKKLKKYIAVFIGILMMGAYMSYPVFAEPASSPSEVEDAEEEDPDEIIPIEEEPDEQSDITDDDPIEFITDAEDTEEPLAVIEPEDDPAETEIADTAAPPPDDSAASFDYTPADNYTMYAMEVVNVRAGPDTSYSKVGTIYANSPVTVIGANGPWLAIKYNNSTAFVFAELFTSTEPKTSTAASTAAPETAAPAETEETTPVTEDTTPDAVIDDPETVPQIVVPDTVVTDKDAETTKSSDDNDDKEKVAATADTDKKDGGFGSLLLALGCAIGVFLIVGVIPVVIHKIHHKRIYQY